VPRRRLAVTLLTLVLFLVDHPAVGATFSLQPAKTYPVGTDPRGIATGDFNADSKTDLVIVNYGDPAAGNDGGVSILFGKGDGTFQAADNVAPCKNCTGVVAGDFNGDGKDDLALIRRGDPSTNDNGEVTLLLGNGDGTFQQGQILTPGKNPGAAVAVDLNADGRLDLVTASATDKSVAVLLGNGDGTFQAPIAYATTAVPLSLAVVDFDRDRKTDLAVFVLAGINFLLGNGDGTFRQGPALASGFPGGFVALGDFNGDQNLDLVKETCRIFRPLGCSISLLLGNGDGTFQPPLPLSQPVRDVADFDGDGRLDAAAVVTSNGTQVLISAGDGDGTFQLPVGFSVGSSANANIALVGDINSDHAPDLVLINYDANGLSTNSITTLVNTGTDFSISASQPSPATLTPGQSATSTVTLSLLTNFNNPVSLACEVQPTHAGSPTCSVPTSVAFDGSGEASAPLTISAGTPTASVPTLTGSLKLFYWQFLWVPIMGLALMAAGASLHKSILRRLPRPLLGGTLFAALILQVGCGGGGNGPKSQTYTITVTGTSEVMQHSTTVTLNVQ
jgi:hypothetical protein